MSSAVFPGIRIQSYFDSKYVIDKIFYLSGLENPG